MSLHQSVTVPTTTSGWIQIYNLTGNSAPGGGNAFVAGSANNTTGQVGVNYSGIFPASAKVVISRPAYEDLTAESVTIVAASSM